MLQKNNNYQHFLQNNKLVNILTANGFKSIIIKVEGKVVS